MTASPEVIRQLRASRPAASATLRASVRELATADMDRSWLLSRLRLPGRRLALVVVPAVAALALVSAGVVGLARPGGAPVSVPKAATDESSGAATPSTTPQAAPGTRSVGPAFGSGAITPSPNRAQRVTATITVEVPRSDAVSQAAQDALDLTRSLGGHVVNADVETGDAGRASLTVRVPVGKVQQAITGLSALGKITSQQVTIDDLQESLDTLTRRVASLRSQIVGITARLDTETLDPVTRAQLEERRRLLGSELRQLRRSIASTSAEARYATLQLAVVTPGALGVVPARSRVDRTLDGALNALVWEGVAALAILVVAGPLFLVVLAALIGHRVYRRRETERLLAT